jgi:hypothetical protein
MDIIDYEIFDIVFNIIREFLIIFEINNQKNYN